LTLFSSGTSVSSQSLGAHSIAMCPSDSLILARVLFIVYRFLEGAAAFFMGAGAALTGAAGAFFLLGGGGGGSSSSISLSSISSSETSSDSSGSSTGSASYSVSSSSVSTSASASVSASGSSPLVSTGSVSAASMLESLEPLLSSSTSATGLAAPPRGLERRLSRPLLRALPKYAFFWSSSLYLGTSVSMSLTACSTSTGTFVGDSSESILG